MSTPVPANPQRGDLVVFRRHGRLHSAPITKVGKSTVVSHYYPYGRLARDWVPARLKVADLRFIGYTHSHVAMWSEEKEVSRVPFTQ